jgi:hypothetical protein
VRVVLRLATRSWHLLPAFFCFSIDVRLTAHRFCSLRASILQRAVLTHTRTLAHLRERLFHCAQFSLTLAHSHTFENVISLRAVLAHTHTFAHSHIAHLHHFESVHRTPHSSIPSGVRSLSRLRLRIMEPCMGHTLAGTLDMMRNARQWDHPAAGDTPELRAVPHYAFQSQYSHNGNQVGFPCTHCPPCLVLTSGLCINRRIVRCLGTSLEWTCFRCLGTSLEWACLRCLVPSLEWACLRAARG